MKEQKKERAKQNEKEKEKDTNKIEKRRGEKGKMSTKILKTGKIGIFWKISRS